MAYIVKQKVKGKNYYYLRKSVREGKKVISKNIAYLGKNKKDAEKKAKDILKDLDQGKEPIKKEKIKIKKRKLIQKEISIEELATFCKRKGFIYQSAEIYGGFTGFWDFGHLGVELKNNIKNSWWSFYVQEREDVVGIDGSIITNPKVWQASGHVEGFHDVFVICKKCKKSNKVDKDEVKKVKCDNCGGDYDWETAKEFKLMFKTDVGDKDYGYLRPETAQLIFTNFKNVYENARMKLPFGIAQIGKAFRNEIAPRDFIFRSREFEQMELQYFIDPEKINYCPFYNKIKNKKITILTAEEQTKDNKEKILTIDEMLEKNIFKNQWHAYWLYNSYKWFLGLGIEKNNLRLREHRKDELAHYAKSAVDIEYKFHLGWREIFGSHDRGQFDLGEHEKFSKKNLSIFDEETKKKILPRVIEASFGVERAYLAFMFDSLHKNEKEEIILRISNKLAPIKAAIFPLIKSSEFEKVAEEIVNDLKKTFNVVYDRSGSIGRRYARNDEIGTPYCITIDDKSLKNKDVTIRWRDTTEQKRVKISKLKEVLSSLIDGELSFESLR